jgi:hypothetical protein
MRAHTTNELKFRADILGPDGSTVLASNVYAGIEDLTGVRREQAQLVNAESSHMILFRVLDASTLTKAGYVRIDGLLYIVDWFGYPNEPRPDVWLEVYCHLESMVGS